MILVIDTSSARSAIALLRPDGSVAGEQLGPSGPVFGLADGVRVMREGRPLSRVAVATSGGVVTLTGSVATAAEEKQAIALARNTDGVKDVISRIVVK